MNFEIVWGQETPEFWLYVVWTVWGLVWIAMSFWTARAAKSPGAGPQALYMVVTALGFLLLFGSFEGRPLLFGRVWRWAVEQGVPVRLWVTDEALGWAMVGLAVLGFAFALWARVHHGKLWSGVVGAKAEHRVVDDGPYGVVRHPIYTGLIAGSAAMALEKGNAPALVGLLLIVSGFHIKARLEERFLREALGAEAYDAYSRRVPMLLPFGPK